MREEQEVPFGAIVTMVALVACLFLPIGCVLLKPSFDRTSKMVAESEARTNRWLVDCLSSGGRIVTNGKGTPYYLCFSKDGRLVSTL